MPWVPRGAPAPGWLLLELLAAWRKRGARVLLHDGDPRAATRYPRDLSAAVDIALCNHRLSRLDWHIRTAWWPYGAMAQREMGEPREDLLCHLLFAGIVRQDDAGLYSGRSEVLGLLREMLGPKLTIRTGGPNDRMQAAEVAVSARAVLGFGRPEVPGWVDTRIVQYPGAGGLLLHDDAGGLLEPGVHFIPYRPGPDPAATARAIVEAAWQVEQDRPEMRAAAFAHVQAHHTWRHRVGEALGLLWGPA